MDICHYRQEPHLAPPGRADVRTRLFDVPTALAVLVQRVALQGGVKSSSDERVDLLKCERHCREGISLAGQREQGSKQSPHVPARTDADDADGNKEVSQGLASLHLCERELGGRGTLACDGEGKKNCAR